MRSSGGRASAPRRAERSATPLRRPAEIAQVSRQPARPQAPFSQPMVEIVEVSALRDEPTAPFLARFVALYRYRDGGEVRHRRLAKADMRRDRSDRGHRVGRKLLVGQPKRFE